MGTLRLSLAGAITLALLGTSAAGVVAQPEPEVATGPEFAWVTSVTESNCSQDGSQASGGDGDGFTWLRGVRFGCDLETSDPRVSGTLSGTFGDDCYGDPGSFGSCVFWNAEEIVGPEGSWTGWVWGTHRPEDPEDPQAEPLATLLKVFTGHGAYEGLTFILHGLGPLGGELDFYGLIYEGTPPSPLGELTFAMPSEKPTAEAKVVEAEPAEEPPKEAAAVEEAPVAAEEEADTALDTVTHVTGEALGARTVTQGAYAEVDGGEQMRGNVFEHDIEWSDPRLPSLMRLHESVNVHWIGDDRAAWSWLGNVRLEGEDGAWTGAEYGLGEESDAGITLQPRMMLLSGEGAYEGLSAMLQRQHEVITTGSRPVFEGYIFEGELPPMPDPLEPLAE